jgi:Fe-S-cluster containining protein
MTQRDFLFAMHQYSKEKFNIKEAAPSLCQSCGECCSDNVQFFKSEIKQLKKKYKKFFRGVETIEANEDTFRLVKKSDNNKGDGQNPCVFFNVKGKLCKVYNDRPLICKLYGQSPIASCGYEGYDLLPPISERERLSTSAKEFSVIAMAQTALEFKNRRDEKKTTPKGCC